MDVKISPKWKEWIGREFDKPYFGQLVDFVKQEYAQRRVFPPGRNIFICQYSGGSKTNT